MAKKSFKAETKKLLDLMINSIYTNREIFLRELISNCSDAIDKLKFKSLTAPELIKDGGDFEIWIETDKEHKTLTISDNGIGMTHDEVIENIGTIAKSGSKEFFEKLSESDDNKNAAELIGQFGVGFYSAFMVAEKVKIRTRSAEAELSEGVIWESTGDGNYTVEKAEVEKRGTEITLYLKEDILKEIQLLDHDELEELVTRYSDFIRYPIKMNVEKETVIEEKTLNSMKPIWNREKSDVTEEEYKEFYRHAFHAYDEPVDVIHTKGEGTVEYTALIFIPSQIPFNFYSSHFERGMKLYSKQVFIMDKCKELVPEYLGFIRGIVDSPDFSLNISREILQHSSQLKVISKNLEKKILGALKYMLENDREKYIKFWKEFGKAIKAGVYSDYGMNRDKLQDLLLFESSNSDELTTLDEYVKRMPEGQKEIYYAAGRDKDAVKNTPQMEAIREKGYEVLYFIDKIDEFASAVIINYKEKPLRNISAADLDFDTEEEKKEKEEKRKEKETESKSLLETLKKHLENEVKEVRLSSRLKNSAVCLVSGSDGISINMEQVLSEAAMSNMPAPKATRILEINPDHKIFAKLNEIYSSNPESSKLNDFAQILYNQALLMEGIAPKDPVKFASMISEFMSEVPV
ncbi:MAG: molecular chaperone HtpG [bacterium]|jgi:molecular chaperone HtpG|nr:molecular chaperone HtpG [bacterium]